MKRTIKTRTFLIVSLVFIMIIGPSMIINAANNGILNNGLGGIYIDIYGSTYTDESNEYKGNAYTKLGCTWFATARVEELTGKNLGVYSGSNWWNNYYGKYGFSRSNVPRENSIICFSGHVAVLEKIVDGIAYISEGGVSSDDGSHGYCRIHACKVSEIASKYEKGGDSLYGYLYFEPLPTMDLNKTSLSLDFGEVAYLEVTSEIPSGKTVTWTTSDKNIVSLACNGNTVFLTGAGSGTATVTATCGDMKATCKVTVDGGDDTSTLTITDTGVTKITETSARINATISPGMIIEEAGFYYGTSKSSLTQKKETVNAYTETLWYDLGTDKWTSALKPDTTYYYQLYVKVNGETYKTSVNSFKTAQGATYTLTNSEVSKLTTTSARIKATLSPGVTIEKAGFYYGTSSSSLTKKTETVNAYTETVYYDLGTDKWCSALKPNTKYYYQLYVIIDGTEYKSKLATFTTASNKLVEDSDKFTSLSVSDITETSAKIRAEYPKAVYDDAGFYFGSSSDLASMKKMSEYTYGGTPSTSYVNSYKLGVEYDGYGYKWSDPLESGTKYYYAFYLVLDGTEYVSKVQNFTTAGDASITNVSVTSYPTKRDYVVGEKIDTSGVKLKVTYSNGTTKNITSGITVSGSASATGTRQITLKYEGYTFKYNINVNQPLTSISLNKNSVVMNVDDVVTLSVTYNPADTTDSKETTWTSSNSAVATVSNGMVIATGGGTATITATCGEKTATCRVTVKIPVTGVELNTTSAILTSEDETLQLTATVLPGDADDKSVTWTSSDPSVATVDANGKVTAVADGTTIITVTTASGEKTANCEVTVDITIPLLILSEPDNQVADEGEYVTFAVSAQGKDLSYQWQFCKDGVYWSDSSMEGCNTPSMKVQALASRDGYQYRCIITDKDGNWLKTEAVTLTVKTIEITKQPISQTVFQNAYTVFTVGAEGNSLRYQWQFCKDGVYWSNSSMEGSNTPSMKVQALASRDGYQYRCIITDANGKEIKSDAATLKVATMEINKQPESQTITKNAYAVFTVEAEGENLSYQWQFCKDGVYWSNSSMEGSKTSSMKVQGVTSRNGYQYRCVITDTDGNTVVSNAATLKVTDLEIIKQPESQKITKNAYTVFTIEAEGNDLSYQWQFCRDGEYWSNSSMEGSKTASMTVQALSSRDGYQYRCVITDADGNAMVSEAATLIVTAIEISKQPASQSVIENGYTVFTVEADGDGLSYQWQFCKDGEYWSNSSMEGSKTASMTVQALSSRDGYQYRCVVTDADGNVIVSEAATLTVTAIEISKQPASQTVTENAYTSFSVEAKGNGISYQWQFCRDGEYWSNSSMEGSKTASMTVQALSSRDGYQYRCVITDSDGNIVISEAATLTVK